MARERGFKKTKPGDPETWNDNNLYWALFAAVELATSMVKLSDTFLRMAKGEIGLDDLDVQVQ